MLEDGYGPTGESALHLKVQRRRRASRCCHTVCQSPLCAWEGLLLDKALCVVNWWLSGLIWTSLRTFSRGISSSMDTPGFSLLDILLPMASDHARYSTVCAQIFPILSLASVPSRHRCFLVVAISHRQVSLSVWCWLNDHDKPTCLSMGLCSVHICFFERYFLPFDAIIQNGFPNWEYLGGSPTDVLSSDCILSVSPT